MLFKRPITLKRYAARPANGLPTIYVGRPGPWGNPYPVDKSAPDRDEERMRVLIAYLDYISMLSSEDLQCMVKALANANLECWCKPKPCHADLQLALSNNLPAPRWLPVEHLPTFEAIKARISY